MFVRILRPYKKMDLYKSDRSKRSTKKSEKKRFKDLFKLVNEFSVRYLIDEPIPNVLGSISRQFYTAIKMLARSDVTFSNTNTIGYTIQNTSVYKVLMDSVYDRAKNLLDDEVLAFVVSSGGSSRECFIIKVQGTPRLFFYLGLSDTNLKDCFEYVEEFVHLMGAIPRIMVTIFKIRSVEEIMRKPAADTYDSDDDDDDEGNGSSSDIGSTSDIHIEKLRF